MGDLLKISRALISVYDKSGLLEICQSLNKFGVDLISTGNTCKFIRENGFECKEVSEVTKFPEILDGRVKTLHPNIHAGILAVRDKENHTSVLEARNIPSIDLVIANLYPFEESVKSGMSSSDCQEQIDIGGPAMIRAGAKNNQYVTVITDPLDYPSLIKELKNNNGKVSSDFRKNAAMKAFFKTAFYDFSIASWISSGGNIENGPSKYLCFFGSLDRALEYGENPHQKAAQYKDMLDFNEKKHLYRVQGKEMSFNNMNDAFAAIKLLKDFKEDGCFCTIIKHKNPCGAAFGKSHLEAYRNARSCHEDAAFGGIVGVNGYIDEDLARDMISSFLEVIICYGLSKDAEIVFSEKPNLRVLIVDKNWKPSGSEIFKTIDGYLAQDLDMCSVDTPSEWHVVTKKTPSKEDINSMFFSWRVAKHVASNAIVVSNNAIAIGIGAGQMSRLDSLKIASDKAIIWQSRFNKCNNLVMASDGFIPFSDSIFLAARCGISCIVQPGGSKRDSEVISAADDIGISMVFTGIRHFKH